MRPPKRTGSPDVDVASLLAFLEERGIWPNGPRFLFTDAFGVLVLLALHARTGDRRWLARAREVVAEVHATLGCAGGLRSGTTPDLDVRYYHHQALWLHALTRLTEIDARWRATALAQAKALHAAFVVPGIGVRRKLGPNESGNELGAVEPFYGYVFYRLLSERALAREIDELRVLVELAGDITVRQDLALGELLWLAGFFPSEPWAELHRARALDMLDRLWVDPPGYFCRLPGYETIKYAFANYMIAIGLTAADERPERRWLLHEFFHYYRSHDEYDRDAITHVMCCASTLAPELVSSEDRSP